MTCRYTNYVNQYLLSVFTCLFPFSIDAIGITLVLTVLIHTNSRMKLDWFHTLTNINSHGDDLLILEK